MDKPTDWVAIVEIEAVETRWAVIEHGDHIPVLRVSSRLVRPILGSGPELDSDSETRLTTLHFDYSDMLGATITPPPVIGRRYLLFASSVEETSPAWLERIDVDHIAHAQGSFLLRGDGENRHIFWDGQRYLLRDIESSLISAGPLPLSDIESPGRRRDIAAQRLTEGKLSDPNDFVTSLVDLIRDTSSFKDWYESLALLRRAARQEDLRGAVLEALHGRLDEVDLHRQRAIAIVLAEQGDARVAPILRQVLADADFALNSDPGGNLILPNRLPHDSSSTAAAAWALGSLGEQGPLGHEDLDVRLAAAGGLMEHGGEGVRRALLPIATELDKEVETLRQAGTLDAPREANDYRQRYPHHWVRVHQILSRLGDDESLRRLAEANRQDWATYPETERAAFPRMQIARWNTAPFSWPSLKQALTTADADPVALLGRLAALYEDDDEILVAVRASFRKESEPEGHHEAEPSPESTDADTLALIAEQLASTDPEIRARGLAGAGFQQVEEHFELVLETALDGTGVEKQASLYGLGFYDREISTEALERLSREGGLQERFSGVELATRKHPELFVEVTLAYLRDLVTAVDEGEFENRSLERFAPRLVSRFCRTDPPVPILLALEDENEKLAATVAFGLGLGGNPDVIDALAQTVANRNGEPKQAAEWALEALGAE